MEDINHLLFAQRYGLLIAACLFGFAFVMLRKCPVKRIVVLASCVILVGLGSLQFKNDFWSLVAQQSKPAPTYSSEPPDEIVAHVPNLLVRDKMRQLGRFNFSNHAFEYTRQVQWRDMVKYENGVLYKGEWVKGEEIWEGNGILVQLDESVYEGQLRRGKPHGHGRMIFHNGNVYEGTLVDGQFKGQGNYTWADGQVYSGSWRHNEQHGKGTMRYANGDVYEGSWSFNKMEGKANYTFSNGNVYRGKFKDGTFHGKGSMTYFGGDLYVGQWLNGKRDGQGTYKHEDEGRFYKGQWKNNLRHGLGVNIYPNGTQVKAKFVKGVLFDVVENYDLGWSDGGL